MSVSIECDECGNDELQGKDIVCSKCFNEEKDRVSDLQKEVEDLQDEKETFEKKIDELENENQELCDEVATLKEQLLKAKGIDDILGAIDKVHDGMIEMARIERAEKKEENVGVPDEQDLQSQIAKLADYGGGS